MNFSSCLTSSSVETSTDFRYWIIISTCGSSIDIFRIRFNIFRLEHFQNLKINYPLPIFNVHLIEHQNWEKFEKSENLNFVNLARPILLNVLTQLHSFHIMGFFLRTNIH